jgi:hypothetical protein
VRKHPAFWVFFVLIGVLAFTGSFSVDARAIVNFITDDSFETMAFSSGVRIWTIKGSGYFTDDVSREGRASAVLQGPHHFNHQITQRVYNLSPGTEYVLSAWVKAEEDLAIASLGVSWYGGYTNIYRGLKLEEGWQKIELAFLLPMGSQPWVEVLLSGEHDGKLWWDNIELYEAKGIRELLAQEWTPRLEAGEVLYTGLVINAKGLGVERGMSPKIYDEDGRVLYAGSDVSTEQLINAGIVAYTKDLSSAIVHHRLSIHPEYPLSHPLVIDALAGKDRPKTGVVIGKSDAQALLNAIKEYDFLGRFAVVFVVD